MYELTNEERKWLKKLQKVLNECPSNRMEAFTIGDNNLTIYDVAVKYSEEASNSLYNYRDWCQVVYETGTELAQIKFPFAIAATAG